jgi:hypothetical protein
MKLLIKIIFFLLAVFQTNISEAKVFVFDDVVSEIKFTVFDVEIKNESSLVSEKDFGLTCKSESDLVVYRNWAKDLEATAAKGVTNLIPEGKLANHLFKGAGKLADNPANRSLIQNLANSKALGVDAFGKSWHMGLDGAGKSIYTYTQNGVVKGAGYATMTAEQMILKYGLK